MAAITCPNCSKHYVRRVRREGLFERLLSLGYIYPFRCQLCSTRFRARQPGVRYTRVKEDRREYERIPVRFPVTLAIGHASVRATALDISMAGCSLETIADLRTGMVLPIRFEPAEQIPFSVEAALVRYIHTNSIGLQFLQFQGDERHQLESLIRALLANQEKLLHRE